MIGPPSPFTPVSLGGGSTEELVEAAVAAAADVVMPFDLAPGLQPDACIVISNGSRITAWAVDTWPAGDVWGRAVVLLVTRDVWLQMAASSPSQRQLATCPCTLSATCTGCTT